MSSSSMLTFDDDAKVEGYFSRAILRANFSTCIDLAPHKFSLVHTDLHVLFQELPGCLDGRAQVVRDALHQFAQPGAGFGVKGFQVDAHRFRNIHLPTAQTQ
jgi:hypothetical protein